MSSRQTAEIPVSGALGALVIPRSRLVLVLATALVGLLVAFALAIALPADQRTFIRIVPLTQLIISVLTPFSAALLTHDLRDSTGTVREPVARRRALRAGGRRLRRSGVRRRSGGRHRRSGCPPSTRGSGPGRPRWAAWWPS